LPYPPTAAVVAENFSQLPVDRRRRGCSRKADARQRRVGRADARESGKKGQPSFRLDFILFRVEIEIKIVEKYIKKSLLAQISVFRI
jgi:hypothetical protein